jgi:LDH2 family malate/lactate/ureidoglycolate dehydrogenase
MACSIVARGKLKFAAQRGEPIPEGLALDKQGRPTTDGAEAFEGVVLPMGGVKGAGLSMLMDVLSGVHTGRHSAATSAILSPAWMARSTRGIFSWPSKPIFSCRWTLSKIACRPWLSA